MKMNIRIKKAATFIITLSMLIGFIPMGLFAYSADNDWAGTAATVNYKFPSPSPQNQNLNLFTAPGIKPAGVSLSGGTSNWYSDGNYSAASMFIRYSSVTFKTSNANDFFALIIKLPETAGKYTLKMDAGNPASSYDFWMFDYTTTVTNSMLAVGNANYVGTATYPAGAANRAAGTYIVTNETKGQFAKVVFKASSGATAGASTSNYGTLGCGVKGFTLDGEKPAELESASLVITSGSVVRPSKDVHLSAKGKMSDGTAADLSKATIVYSTTSDRITVTDGVVKYKGGEGTDTATVTASVTLGGITKEAEIKINVSSIDITYEYTEEWAGADATCVYDFRYGLEDGTAYAHQTTIYSILEYDKDKNPNWKYAPDVSAINSGYATMREGFARLSMGSADKNQGYGFVIKMPEKPGKYKIEIKHKAYHTAPQADIYLCDLNAEQLYKVENRKEQTHLGTAILLDDPNNSTAVFTATVGQYIVTPDEVGTEKILFITSEELNTNSSEMTNGGIGTQGMFIRSVSFVGEKPLEIADVDFRLSAYVLPINKTATASVTATLENGKTAVLNEATQGKITFSSDNENVATVDALTGEVKPVAHGVANITATVTLDGYTKTATRKVECVSFGGEQTSSVIDLMAGLSEGENAEFSDYNADKNARWKYGGNYMNATGRAVAKNGAVRFIAIDEDSWSAIKFKSGARGAYQLKLEYENHVGARSAKAYLFEGNVTDIDNSISLVNPIAEFDYDSSEGAHTVNLGEIALMENSEYILVLQASKLGVNGSEGYATHSVSKLIFDGEAPVVEAPVLSEVVLSLVERLALNGTGIATVSAKMSDGSAADLTGATITYLSSDPNVLEINATTGTMLAKAGGDAIVTATVKIGEDTKEASATVKVLVERDDLTYLGIENSVEYDFIKGLARSGESVANLTEYNPEKNTNWVYVNKGTHKGASTFYGALRVMGDTVGQRIVFKIKAPEEGIYRGSYAYSGGGAANKINVYLLPGNIGDEGVVSAYQNATTIATFGFEKSDLGDLRYADLGELKLSGQTDYYIVLEVAELGNPTSGLPGNFYLNKIILSAAKPLESLTVGLDNGKDANVLAIGDSCGILKETPSSIVEASEATYTYASSDEEVATVSADGIVTAHKTGYATITVTATLGTVTRDVTFDLVAGSLKSRRTYYNDEEIGNALANIEKYDWALATRKSAVAVADKYVDRYEELYNMITTNALPRGSQWYGDPFYTNCRYCGTNNVNKHGKTWIIDPMDVKWKVQCPECRRYFPSNDFGKYYELGIDEHGIWDPAVSKQKNDELVANGEVGYLANILYPEKDEYVDKEGVLHNEGIHGWGVDNGFGYDTGRNYAAPYDTVKEVHVYIPAYNASGLWAGGWGTGSGGVFSKALNSLRDAYVYTGEEKYGIAGAIILDRIADIYPTMKLDPDWRYKYVSSSGGSGRGRINGCIGDYITATNLAWAYDAFWPAMENQKVINFLSNKAQELKLDNPKTSAELIRYNADNGLLREIRKGVHDLDIWGNFGYQQTVMATIGVVLDTMPESKEWIDWIFEPSETGIKGETGQTYVHLINTVDRDGWGNEAAPAYNNSWINSIGNIAAILLTYKDTYAAGNLYENAKYRRMIFAGTELTMASRYIPNIGDTGQYAKPGSVGNRGLFVTAWNAGIHDDNIARMIYLLSDGDISDLNGGIRAKDPYAIQREIQAVIDEKGPMVDHASTNLGGVGIMITRDGEWKEANNGFDTQRSLWMYYGKNAGHGHKGTLNLGLIAYGIDMAPDLGNPDYKSLNCNRLTWSSTPMAHNTVHVIEENGAGYGATYSNASENGITSGDPYHFDDSGKVKIMDVDVPELYDSTEIYRRTVVEVEVNDGIGYAVDFFRVKGGDDHVYNFHSQSDEVEVDIPMTAQVDASGEFIGSYAGPEIPYGEDELWANAWGTPLKSPVGFTWVKNIYRAENPEAKTLSIDFKINDFFNVLPGDPNLHLKLTVLNTDNEISEFAYGDTRPPIASNSPELIKQLMVRRQGSDLDSLFTSVLQPYKDNAYIASVEDVPVTMKSGYEGKNDVARAVKVTLTSGRVDYVVYATNNNVTYTVDNKFDISAFVGVVSYDPNAANGEPIYTYMNDGTFLAGMTGTDKYTGKVVDFTRDMSVENTITVNFNGEYDIDRLVGQYIYIDNGSTENADANATYKIEGASVNKDDLSLVDLDIGMTTTILSYIDATDASKGFNYLMAEGMDFEIPLSTTDEKNPIVNAIPEQRVEAGNTLTFKVTAQSQTGNALTYKMNDSVAGMVFDEATQVFSWTPTTADRGDNIASFVVSDGLLESVIYVDINVANPTGGAVAGGDTFPDDSPAGGGGGSDEPSGKPTDDPKDEPTDNPSVTPDDGKKFIDLGAHTWAEDAIYELVDAGVINGTSANTYSPAKNITRADFATLAVRLFKFEGNAESFTDVPADKYYAEPVGIAKANGIVNGISETEFAPMKEISREEMMVMLYRALKAAGVELPETVELTHSDFDEVSDYAKEAVEALIKSGLIAGSNGKINPKATATRAEVAVVLSRIYALLNK